MEASLLLKKREGRLLREPAAWKLPRKPKSLARDLVRVYRGTTWGKSGRGALRDGCPGAQMLSGQPQGCVEGRGGKEKDQEEGLRLITLRYRLCTGI